MPKPEKNINLTVISSSGKEYHLKTFRGEYRNLMMLIYDQCLEDIGDCKGIGLCGTCHVEIINNPFLLSEPLDGQEEETLSKLYQVNERSRLSCQIMIDEKIDGLIVRVLGDSNQDIGIY